MFKRNYFVSFSLITKDDKKGVGRVEVEINRKMSLPIIEVLEKEIEIEGDLKSVTITNFIKL